MDSHLARFFPAEQSDVVSARHGAERLHHLHRLYQTLSTYTPLEVLQHEMRPDAPPDYAARDASLLFADVSGFTALSEQLAALGREGAEQVTTAMNQYFSAMLEILSEYGGSILKFGGDALVVAFYHGDHAPVAASAALALQQRMGQWQARSSFGEVPLRLGIGLGSGELLLLRLGNRQRRELVLLGTAAEEIALAEEKAAAGEIVVGPTMLAALPERWVQRREGRVGWLEASVQPLPPTAAPENALPSPSEQPESLAAQLDTLAAYLPEGLLERLLLDPTAQIEGEHRMVTVLFANVVNLPAYLPTHEGRAAITAILQDYFVTMQAIITRFGGAVNKIDVAGEGYKLMALFGAPIAHEDDAVRGVQAALAMQQALPELNRRASEHLGEPVALGQSIGLNSGIVFAGNVGSKTRQEYSVMGDHVNLAARIMGKAEPETVLISAETRHFLPPSTPLTAVPPVRVKGKREPVPLFRVEPWETLAPFVVRQRAALVGRGPEMAVLHEALEMVRQGRGQALFLYGEAGVGKSRLLAELLPESEPLLLLEGRCLSYGSNIPYHPWRTVLQTLLRIDINAPADLQRQAAYEGVAALLPEQVALFPLLGPVLGFDLPHSPTTAQLSPELRQQRLLALISDLFLARAAQQPLLLVMDDVQWLDAVSASLLAFVTRQIGEAPILVLILGRLHPREQLASAGSDLPTLPFFSAMEIQELSREEALALASALLSQRGLSEAEQRLILERAGGNPFYIEELAEALANEGSEVPDTLHGLIMSRLDRLPERSRRVLQIASVVGRRFDEPLLCGVYPYGDQQVSAIPARLNDLAQQGILDLERVDPTTLYLFHQVLTHEVAYDSLLFARRRELHQHIGNYLLHHPSDWLGDQVALLSHHFYLAQQWEGALTYTLLAADRARDSYANEAAIALYQRALEIVSHLKDSTPETWVRLWQSLGDVYTLVGRYDEALERYEEALQATTAPLTRIALYECRARAWERKGNLAVATEQIAAAKGLLEESEDAHKLVLARLEQRQGWLYSLMGNYPLALERVHHALELFDTLDASQREVMEALALTLRSMGAIQTSMSHLVEAMAYHRQALHLYEALNHPSGIAYCYDYIAEVYYLQGNFQGSMEALDRSLNVQRKIGDAYGLVAGLNNRGILYLHAGNLDEARESYLESLRFARQIGSLQAIGRIFNNLAELHIKQGTCDEAEEYLDQAEVLLRQVGDQASLKKLESWREAIAQRRLELNNQPL